MDNKLLIQDLAEAIATKEGLTKKKSEAFVKALFETIEEGLLADKFVKIKGLGTFKIITVGERESVNINTGERFSIEGHEKITFTPDTVLKDLVNRPFAHFQTVILNEETDIDELESVDSEQEDPSSDPSTNDQDNDNDRDEDDLEEVEDSEEPKLSEDIEEKVSEDEEKLSEETSAIPGNEEQTTAEDALPTSQVTEEQESLQERAVQKETNLKDAAAANATEESHDPTGVSPETLSEPQFQESDTPISQNETSPSEGKQPASTLESENFSEIDKAQASPSSESQFNHPQEEPTLSETQDKPSQLSPMKEENEADEVEKSQQRAALHDESQQEIKYIIKELENKRNTWKTISIILLSILLLFLSYFAGYFRWFCPCELLNNKESQTLLCPAPEESDTGALQKISAETLDSTRVLIQDKDSIPMEEEVPLEKVEPAPSIKQDVPVKRATTQTKEKAKSDLPKEHKEQAVKTDLQTDPLESQYNQVPGGRYKIVGTLRTHKIQNGETIRTIALDVYGSKGYAIYIITHNSLDNPDMVDTGTVLKLPKLERRKK